MRAKKKFTHLTSENISQPNRVMLMTKHGTFGPDRRRLEGGEIIKEEDFRILRKQGHSSDSYVRNTYFDLIEEGDPIIGAKFSSKNMKPIFRCIYYDPSVMTDRDHPGFNYENTIELWKTQKANHVILFKKLLIKI